MHLGPMEWSPVESQLFDQTASQGQLSPDHWAPGRGWAFFLVLSRTCEAHVDRVCRPPVPFQSLRLLQGSAWKAVEARRNLGCSFKIFILPINFCVVAFATLVTKATRITTSAHWNAQGAFMKAWWKTVSTHDLQGEFPNTPNLSRWNECTVLISDNWV